MHYAWKSTFGQVQDVNPAHRSGEVTPNATTEVQKETEK
jgi:hypothetical protein